MATAKVLVTRSATVGVEDLTLASLQAASTKVGASADARVSIGGQVPRNNNSDQTLPDGYFQNSVTFSWSEEV